MIRTLPLLFLVAAGPPPPAWEQAMTNPRPAASDLVLPLPCGGAMAFVPVDVPAGSGPLDDRPVTLGDAGRDLGYSEYLRVAWLAAPFPGEAGGRRYYLGKYDVTRDQYAAMRAGQCPTPLAAGRAPQTGISWFEAVDAAAAWSGWLLANARDRLPRREAAYAYARLPTEEEWEYAARGGSRVGEEDFLARTWPMPEGIERYAMAGSRSAAGHVQPVGQMLGNPLGLYDMLGNAGQMMLEPYRLNRVGRQHGQAGGIVVRGGNYTSPPASLHTAMRDEIPPFDAATNAPTRLATVGFRLVLSAPSVGSLEETRAADAAFEAVSGAQQRAADSPTQMIALLREQAADDTLRAGLDRLTATLAGEARARGDDARVALGAQLETATVLAQNVWSLENTARLQEALAGIWTDPEQAKAIRAAAASRRIDQAGSLDGYVRVLRQIATGPAHDDLAAAADIVRQQLRDRGQGYLTMFLEIVDRQAIAWIGGHPPARPQALADILAVPPQDARTK